MLHQVAGGEGRPDHGWGEDFRGGRDDFRAHLQRAGSQRNVVGDHHVACFRPISDPVISGIRASVHQHELYAGFARRANEGVGDNADIATDPARDLVDLFLHGARVCIDIDDHDTDLPSDPRGVQSSARGELTPLLATSA